MSIAEPKRTTVLRGCAEKAPEVGVKPALAAPAGAKAAEEVGEDEGKEGVGALPEGETVRLLGKLA